jgi:hypothetical protein
MFTSLLTAEAFSEQNNPATATAIRAFDFIVIS